MATESRTTSQVEKATIAPEMEESIVYRKKEEGTTEGGLKFLRYEAMNKNGDQPISVKAWAQSLATSTKAHILAKDLSKLIVESHFSGVYFETKGVTSLTAAKQDMQIVIVEANHLEGSGKTEASSTDFSEYLSEGRPTDDACKFTNLGGDAQLIAPLEKDGDLDVDYSHLKAFLSGAPQKQIEGVWKMVATTYLDMLKEREGKPLWLSTAGDGVPWLHFRLDYSPKWFKYMPFTTEPT